jgi:hypothetical protein
MFVGLVSDPRWEPPDDLPDRDADWMSWIPWGTLAYVAAFWTLLALASAASREFGSLVGYLVILGAVALAGWRLERWMSRQNWGGMRDYQQ